jgi:hypothetical protein
VSARERRAPESLYSRHGARSLRGRGRARRRAPTRRSSGARPWTAAAPR